MDSREYIDIFREIKQNFREYMMNSREIIDEIHEITAFGGHYWAFQLLPSTDECAKLGATAIKK